MHIFTVSIYVTGWHVDYYVYVNIIVFCYGYGYKMTMCDFKILDVWLQDLERNFKILNVTN